MQATSAMLPSDLDYTIDEVRRERFISNPPRVVLYTVFEPRRPESAPKFMEEFEDVAAVNGWDNRLKIFNFRPHLKGTAREWFDKYAERNGGSKWKDLRRDFEKRFYPVRYRYDVEKELILAQQMPGEDSLTYFEKIQNLCSRMDAEMAESERVGRIMNGLLPWVLMQVRCRDPSNTDELFEALRLSIGHWNPSRQDQWDTTSAVQQAPRYNYDEKSQFNDYKYSGCSRYENRNRSESRPDRNRDDSVIRNSCREKDSGPRYRARRDSEFNNRDGNCAHRNRSESLKDREKSSHKCGNDKGQWESRNSVPKCYKCGIRGHIARECDV